jgi:hypothetical protein
MLMRVGVCNAAAQTGIAHIGDCNPRLDWLHLPPTRNQSSSDYLWIMLLCCADPPVAAEYEVPSATAVLPNTRRVYRLLKTRDIRPSLKDTEVHVLWPDNGIWYLAEVLEVRNPNPLLQPGQCSTCRLLLAVGHITPVTLHRTASPTLQHAACCQVCP